jgi:hypothetical protein
MRIFIIDVARMKTHVVVNILKRVKCQSSALEIIGVSLWIDTGIVEITEKAFVLDVSLSYDIWFSRTWVLKIFVMNPLAGPAS